MYCTVLYCTVLYCTVLYCTVLYCTVLCYHSYFKETVESQYKYYTINMKYFSPNTNIHMDPKILMCADVLKFCVFMALACFPL